VLLQVKNGRERSSALRGLREMERQVGSVRGTRWTAGLVAGHMVATQARRSHGQARRCTVAVESSGLAGGRTEHAGFGSLPTKPSADGFLVWASKPSPRAQHDGDGIRACREARSMVNTNGKIAVGHEVGSMIDGQSARQHESHGRRQELMLYYGQDHVLYGTACMKVNHEV
jgi:hypothetical protein